MSCSTNEKPYPKAMIQAEECITAHPDSALAYLATLKEEIKNEPKETQMYYNLLTIKAQDKAYMPHTSDSLIKITTDFYENYGDSDKLMEAYYYLGSTYRDMNDAPQALKAYQDAVDIGKNSKKHDVIGQTYGQIGKLLSYQGLYDASIIANQKALYCCKLEKNRPQISLAKRNIARMYTSKGILDSALVYYQEAYEEAQSFNNKEIIENILGEIGCLYYDIGKLDSAKTILQKLATKEKAPTNVILNLGLVFQHIGQADAAQYYLHKVIESDDIYKKEIAYRHLAAIEASKNNYQKALEYEYNCLYLKDSIDIITQTETIGKIQALYNYQHIEKEKDKLSIEYENKRALVYQLFLILISVIAISFFIIVFSRKKKQIIIEQERKLRQLKEKQYTESLEYIEDNKRKQKILETQLYEIEEEKDSLSKQLIETQKELLELSNQQVIVARNKKNLLESSFKQSRIYLLFHKSNDETIKITEEDWNDLHLEIDKTYHNFTDKLYTLYPQLSLVELRICYLIKISMQVKDIARLLNRSKSAISIARTRLYKKIHGSEGSVEMMDKFIIDL